MLSYGVLGPLHVERDGVELALQTPMLRRLLGLLLCHDGHAVSADTLTSWLWGERPPATARKTLQNYVVRLRRVLGDPTAVRHHAADYRLSLADECVDLRLFQRDAAEGNQFSHTDPRPALRCYSRALDRRRGNAFEGLLDLAVIASYAHRLEEQRPHVLEQACEIRLDLGQHAEVAAALPQAIEQHPFRERLRELLMLALHKGGRQQEALREYQRVWETMTGELGIAPGSRLRLLQQQILRDDPALWGNRLSPSGPGRRPCLLAPRVTRLHRART